MIDPRKISINDYSYSLPENLIAQEPLGERDASRLLVYKNNIISESSFSLLTDFIPEESLLLFNQSKVVQARLQFQKNTGAVIECMCIEPGENMLMEIALRAKGSALWNCMIGNAKRWKDGFLEKELLINNENIVFKAERKTVDGQENLVEFTWAPVHYTFSEILEYFGELPLPPYMHREPEELDKTRYNTVYAENEGSVAAPTAGLHFTSSVLSALNVKKINSEYLTLHVGAGTFKPVRAETMSDHAMHSERIYINKNNLLLILDTKKKCKPVVAVGTTSLRTIESVYWFGVKLLNAKEENIHFEINQWDPYQYNDVLPELAISFQAVLEWMEKNQQPEIIGLTKLLIVPGYRFQVVDQLITNFHQPNSTLLLLVAAFIGEDWRKVYQFALSNQFRFLSYGDSSLLCRN